MGWVREAIDDAASKSFEELFPTAYKSSTSGVDSHLPTDYGIPTEPQPKPPSSSATSTRAGASPPRNPTADDPNAAEHEGTRTPSIRDIEKEYSGVEDRSKKPGRRLSRLAGDLANWMHVT
ncbi:hypothetical protein Daus18300_005488 [Diaporthe australafricana]|uniref:Uncharacterized protein n=1 Tax=Diaporthe australafricana TaxID=127596 RepID=A0ABR3X185_9PEZI